MIKFGTGGFRGVIGDDFTRSSVGLIAQGLCEIIRQDGSKTPIVIGYDRRFMSDVYAGWMSEVFAANGIDTLLYTTSVPSPTVMCATKQLGHDYGVMITASHNPYVFNGVKLFVKNGADADVAFTDRLEKLVNGGIQVKSMSLNAARDTGIVKDFDNMDEYLANIKSFITLNIRTNNAKILYDNMCGVGVVGLKRLAKEFNIKKFDLININHDAFFNFITPNPTVTALLYLRDRVVNGGYDYAIATDSDGDRLGVLDERGNSVNNNDILAMLYYYLVKYRGMRGDIVKNCSTSVLIDRLAAKLGFKCHQVDVGFKNISSKMKETDALIGGESSGGLTVRNYIYGKDSIFSASLFMEMQIVMNKPVSQIVREVHEFAEYDYATYEDAAALADERIFENFKAGGLPEGEEVNRIEAFNQNVKLHYDGNCWVLLRLSGTEPLLRLVAEMPNAETAEKKVALYKQFIEEQNARFNC